MQKKIVVLLAAAIPAEDWKMIDREVAKKHNISMSTVHRVRKLVGIQSDRGNEVHDLSNVDFRKSNAQIMRETGCSKHTVSRARSEAGVMPEICSGRKGLSKWSQTDWTLDNSELAQIYETTKEYIGSVRRRMMRLHSVN